jgi:hypothetical protein
MRRPQLTYSNVVATLALFVALGGSSYAAITITGRDVQDESLTGADVKNSSLAGSDVKNGALAGADVKNGSLAGIDVKNNSLTGADIKESTLKKVPDSVTKFNLASKYTDPVKTIILGESGPLTFTALCSPGTAGGATTGAIRVQTDEDNVSIYANRSYPDLDIADGAKTILQVTTADPGRVETTPLIAVDDGGKVGILSDVGRSIGMVLNTPANACRFIGAFVNAPG